MQQQKPDAVVKIEFVNRSGLIKLPEYQTIGSAGADLQADITEPVRINPGERVSIPTGIKMEIPEGYEVQARGRSGLAAKHGVVVVHGVGTIDSDYRGELCALLINHSGVSYTVNPGDRVLQAVVAPVTIATFVEVDKLSETDRGSNGWGSTGR